LFGPFHPTRAVTAPAWCFTPSTGNAILPPLFPKEPAPRSWPTEYGPTITLEYNEAVQGWNNIMLRLPPEQHILKFLVIAANNRTVADDFGAMFDQPVKAWRIFSSPGRTEAYLSAIGRQTDGPG
jgi:hypothetical protein